MKISFYGNFNEEPTEGRFKIVRRLTALLEEKGFKVVFNSKDADIIHTHSSGIALARQITKIKRKTKIPCIYSLYSTCESALGDYLRYYTEQWRYFQNELSLKHFLFAASSVIPLKQKSFVFKNLDCVVVPSESMKKNIQNDNTKVIHLGVDVNKYRKIRIDYRKKFVVGFAGHPNASKGLLEYLRATKILTDLNCNFELKAFITEIPNKLKDYIISINDKVRLYENPKSMLVAYNSLDVITLPFRMGLSATANPLVLLEAMACEKSVITTNLPNIGEIVKEGGVLVDPYSPEQIADNIFKLQDEKLRKKLGKKAREIIVNRYNERKMVEEYIKVYEDLI